MATRNALVLVNGVLRELPAGDSLNGVTLKVPVYETETAAVMIDLVAGYTWTLPVYNAAGVAVQVGL